MIELAADQSQIGEREIREIHGFVMKGQSDSNSGRYRTLDVKAAGTDYIYPSHLKVHEMMETFVKWLAESPGLHPVEFASEAHIRFVTIHLLGTATVASVVCYSTSCFFDTVIQSLL